MRYKDVHARTELIISTAWISATAYVDHHLVCNLSQFTASANALNLYR